ncbi:MAG TPA: hypothetical protein H9735_07605 [Candidatus Anaerostipes excrementavium]|uniref:Uncharacterized protein n=1 Tax=Candidatus Anaerostipes excrementavium TaxID=2838463 RepID=A0A9D2BA58_9FIRM|nr:hypothetical protein [Candidatus Anaerostipes excrementavium]
MGKQSKPVRGCRTKKISATALFLSKIRAGSMKGLALGVKFIYATKQNFTERLYIIFSVLSNQTSAGCGNFDSGVTVQTLT